MRSRPRTESESSRESHGLWTSPDHEVSRNCPDASTSYAFASAITA
jgi:hypothetical protein